MVEILVVVFIIAMVVKFYAGKKEKQCKKSENRADMFAKFEEQEDDKKQ